MKDRVCHQDKVEHTLESESSVPLTLTHQQCVDLIKRYWANNKTEVLDMVQTMAASVESRKTAISTRLSTITEAQLMSACSAKDLTTLHETKTVSTPVIAISLNPAERIQTTCSKCHSGDHPMSGFGFDLKNILNIPVAEREKMAMRINKGEMPPGGLNVKERGRLASYLLGRAPASDVWGAAPREH